MYRPMSKTTTPTVEGIIAGREAALARVVRHLADDPRIDAVWRGGSIGRGEDDVLSDCDLAVVVAAGYQSDVVAERFVLIQQTGDVVLMLDSPQNSHHDGAQVNALYANMPLPTFFDWNIWPSMRTRPTQVEVLFERAGTSFSNGPPYGEFQDALPHGETPELTPEYLDAFPLAMLTMTAKLAARGSGPGVVRMFELMRESPPAATDLSTVLSSLRSIRDRLAADDLRLRDCMERYFEVLAHLTR